MVKQLLLPLAGVAAFIILVGLLVKDSGNIVIPGITPTPTPSAQKTITVGDTKLNVEIADTKAKRELGLGGRNNLSENTGMLFVFDSKQTIPSFWMKDMLIPLDIIWISKNKVIKIDKNVPAPVQGTSDSKLTIYNPGQPIDYVLEVNTGFSDANHITVGSSVDLSNI